MSLKILGLSLLILIVSFYSCEKKKVPTVTTSEVTVITGTTASSGGTITNEGSGTIISRGVCGKNGHIDHLTPV